MLHTTESPAVTITCALCGFSFDPAEYPACENCPLHAGCPTACCPNCGASNINPQESSLARLIARLFKKKDDEYKLV